ncbi:MAG: hypothetical protein QY318_02240 [Candidatus Dojkabacteria bacterium]|nr:MAG: hypothetical protein QY318_02240 [Candidatus Dojkabacteria bacterium]
MKISSSFSSFVNSFSRVSIFVIYAWFGLLKILQLSPAIELVEQMHNMMLPFIPFNSFYPILGLIEIIIGIMFLVPRATKLAVVALLLHMVVTMLPLILLPGVTWSGFLVPTLAGQYIIKNLAIIALALNIYKEDAA